MELFRRIILQAEGHKSRDTRIITNASFSPITPEAPFEGVLHIDVPAGLAPSIHDLDTPKTPMLSWNDNAHSWKRRDPILSTYYLYTTVNIPWSRDLHCTIPVTVCTVPLPPLFVMVVPIPPQLPQALDAYGVAPPAQVPVDLPPYETTVDPPMAWQVSPDGATTGVDEVEDAYSTNPSQLCYTPVYPSLTIPYEDQTVLSKTTGI